MSAPAYITEKVVFLQDSKTDMFCDESSPETNVKVEKKYERKRCKPRDEKPAKVLKKVRTTLWTL